MVVAAALFFVLLRINEYDMAQTKGNAAFRFISSRQPTLTDNIIYSCSLIY